MRLGKWDIWAPRFFEPLLLNCSTLSLNQYIVRYYFPFLHPVYTQFCPVIEYFVAFLSLIWFVYGICSWSWHLMSLNPLWRGTWCETEWESIPEQDQILKISTIACARLGRALHHLTTLHSQLNRFQTCPTLSHSIVALTKCFKNM